MQGFQDLPADQQEKVGVVDILGIEKIRDVQIEHEAGRAESLSQMTKLRGLAGTPVAAEDNGRVLPYGAILNRLHHVHGGVGVPGVREIDVIRIAAPQGLLRIRGLKGFAERGGRFHRGRLHARA